MRSGKSSARRVGAGADARRTDVREMVRAERPVALSCGAGASCALRREIALPLGIERLWPAIQEISRLHASVGLADPTLGGVVAATISDLAGIDPPRSWPADHKQRFKSLPYDLQVYVAAHELQREKALRRAQNEAASARQKLAACLKSEIRPNEESKPDENDTQPTLEDRIRQVRADIEAIIEARVELVAKESPAFRLA